MFIVTFFKSISNCSPLPSLFSFFSPILSGDLWSPIKHQAITSLLFLRWTSVRQSVIADQAIVELLLLRWTSLRWSICVCWSSDRWTASSQAIKRSPNCSLSDEPSLRRTSLRRFVIIDRFPNFPFFSCCFSNCSPFPLPSTHVINQNKAKNKKEKRKYIVSLVLSFQANFHESSHRPSFCYHDFNHLSSFISTLSQNKNLCV